MNIKRAFGFSAIIYIATFVYGIVFYALGFSSPQDGYSIWAYVWSWVLLVPTVLFFAKWYFRKVQATATNGLKLGIFAIVFSIALDGVFIGLTLASGNSIATFADMYTSWQLYATIIEVIGLTTFAGCEFDRTHTSA